VVGRYLLQTLMRTWTSTISQQCESTGRRTVASTIYTWFDCLMLLLSMRCILLRPSKLALEDFYWHTGFWVCIIFCSLWSHTTWENFGTALAMDAAWFSSLLFPSVRSVSAMEWLNSFPVKPPFGSSVPAHMLQNFYQAPQDATFYQMEVISPYFN